MNSPFMSLSVYLTPSISVNEITTVACSYRGVPWAVHDIRLGCGEMTYEVGAGPPVWEVGEAWRLAPILIDAASE